MRLVLSRFYCIRFKLGIYRFRSSVTMCISWLSDIKLNPRRQINLHLTCYKCVSQNLNTLLPPTWRPGWVQSKSSKPSQIYSLKKNHSLKNIHLPLKIYVGLLFFVWNISRLTFQVLIIRSRSSTMVTRKSLMRMCC